MDSNPRRAPDFVDKTRVLDIKPLRCLVPIFPSQPSSSHFPPTGCPFVCSSPSGPFPPGYVPLYPFSTHTESQKRAEGSPQTPVAVPRGAAHFESASSVSAAVPLTSYKTPSATTVPPSGGEGKDSLPLKIPRRSRSLVGQAKLQNYTNEDVNPNRFSMDIVAAGDSGRAVQRNSGGSVLSSVLESDSEIEKLLEGSVVMQFDSSRRNDGNEDSVKFVLMLFNSLRRRITQHEEAGEGSTKRPDLGSGTLLFNKGIRTNMRRRIGLIPGVHVGDIYFFRIEMCLIGLHCPIMSGIDYASVRIGNEEEPLAMSIVSSGGYEDDNEDENVLFYSGHGKEASDQKLERGNLAMERSLHRANDVRVIRGFKDESSVGAKIYVYDGLYRIQDSWMEKGKSGWSVFKYKLVRLPGQPSAFTTWKSIQQWRAVISSRSGMILRDLTSGVEKLPVCLVNEVDDEKGPSFFNYHHTLKCKESVDVKTESYGCNCKGCHPRHLNCSCIKKNGRHLPYNTNGVLVERLSVIHECGALCLCSYNCHNRVSQGGLRHRLEVFKTKDRGWGLRSWDPIRAGAFICEYAGELIDVSYLEQNGDDFVFDTTRTYLPRGISPFLSEVERSPFPLVISANRIGNVSRFMNHSCSPNVFWQPVLQGDFSESNLHIVFFASRHIPPLTELTFDYGIIETSKGERKKTECLCRSSKCRGYFYR